MPSASKVRPATEPPPAALELVPAPSNFFDLSFSGGLPEILRNLAVELESKSVHGDAFSWHLTESHLQLSCTIAMHPKP